MNVHIKKIITGASAAAAATLLPAVAFAASLYDPTLQNSNVNTTTGIGGVLHKVGDLIGLLVPILLALAVIFFMWGVLMYIMKAGEEQAKAREQMLWGIIAIAVMVSIWGLVGILQSTFGITGNANIAPHTGSLIPTTVQQQK